MWSNRFHSRPSFAWTAHLLEFGNRLILILLTGWFSSQEGSAQPQWFFHQYEDPTSISDDRIRDLLVARDGTVWVATWGSGAIRVMPRTWDEHNKVNGFPSNWVRCIEEDPSGNIWIGTIRGLVCHTPGDQFWTFSSDGDLEIPDDSIYSLNMFDDGTLWVGTESGLLLSVQTCDLDTSSFPASFPGWEVAADEAKTKGGKVRDILETKSGDLWIALGEKGFVRVRPGQDWEYIPGEADFKNSTDLLFEDSVGTLYAGMGGGLYRRKGKEWVKVERVGDSAACAATSPSGDLFVGSGEGLHIRGEDGWRRVSLPLSIGSPTISSIAFDANGGLWLGTYEGLIRGAQVPW
ncbi:MAG: hypothetical protein KC931_21295, partial [Candidatus Omnitrophica bacterium]|nr:hypothetical protein [Candidatus Omnitrophota bacterium]